MVNNLHPPSVPQFVLPGPILEKKPVDPQVIRLSQQHMTGGTALSSKQFGDNAVNKYIL